MLTMMELFSNPDNQALLKAKMEEMKDVSAALGGSGGRGGWRGGWSTQRWERGGG